MRFGLGKEDPLLVSVYFLLGGPRGCPRPPPWALEGQACSLWRAGTASQGPQSPPRLFLVTCPLSEAPLGVPAPLRHPQGAALLQNAARVCQGMWAVTGAWPPSGLGTRGPVLACGSHLGREPWLRFAPLSIVTGKSILKLHALSLLHVLAGSSQSSCLVASLSPGPVPSVPPGMASQQEDSVCRRAGRESPPCAPHLCCPTTWSHQPEAGRGSPPVLLNPHSM